jgi:predicted XRE-type DNA-binding protein
MSEKAFQGALEFLKQVNGDLKQSQIAKALGIQQTQVSLYQQNAPSRISWWKNIFKKVYDAGYAKGQKAATVSIMGAIVDTFGKFPQAEIAKQLKVSQPSVSNWINGQSIPRKEVLEKIITIQVAHLAEPIVEFYRVIPRRSGKSWKVNEKEDEIKSILKDEIGIYIFYDSAGRVTYLGKTEKSLFGEIKQRLNAKVNRPFYNPKKVVTIYQGEVTRYISVYKVSVKEAIHNLEVLMLRAFPNDLANTNVGNFKKGI